MIQCHVVEIVTPKKVRLNGILLGPSRPKRAIVWVHGLGSSMFSKLEIARRLVGAKTSVLMFNNRGHDVVSRISTTRNKGFMGGAAHERFTDCVDDIQGAVNFLRRAGARNVYLVGHSTGCQKSVYWAYKKRSKGVKGIVLLAPVSDLSAGLKLEGRRKIMRAMIAAQSLLRREKKHELLPYSLWPVPVDAQRFLSLFGGSGPEESFTYWNKSKVPTMLKSIRIPVLAILAGKEEFEDRSAREIATWFTNYLQKGKTTIVPRATHSFRGAVSGVARAIQSFLRG